MTNHEKHILLWDELARTGSKDKTETFERLFPDTSHQSDAWLINCWACEECSDQECKECPIDWEAEETPNNSPCENGLFGKWNRARTAKTRKRLAAQIRDLAWVKK